MFVCKKKNKKKTLLAAKGGAGIVRENPALRSIDQLLESPEKKHVGHIKTILTLTIS